MNINNIEIKQFLIEALKDKGFKELTEIQKEAIPSILNNQNTIIKSKTGSGKTLAFLLPLIDKIDINQKITQVLIITPTKELALQIVDVARELTKKVESYKVAPLIGGSDFKRQVSVIRSFPKIIVGTPGRILDHIRSKSLRLNSLMSLVLDEADVMLDMGFRDDIFKIIEKINSDRINILCSATIDNKLKNLIDKVGKFESKIEIDSKSSNNFINQEYVFVHQDKKLEALKIILNKNKNKFIIIFSNTKKMTEILSNELNKMQIKNLALHGDKHQRERNEIMKKIKNLETKILIATDVASRGIDLKNVELVINFDIPYSPESYTHRIGRSGRAGNIGHSITIVNKKPQLSILRDIIKETDNEIKEIDIGISRNTNTKDKRKRINKTNNKKIENTKNYKKENNFKKVKDKNNKKTRHKS